MVIAVKEPNYIIMTADKRITTSNVLTRQIISVNDNSKKIRIFNNQYIVSYAGRLLIAEKSLEFVYERRDLLLKCLDPNLFFSEAFQYGKAMFKDTYPNLNPDATFFVGYFKDNMSILRGFSSDDDFTPINLNATIKANSTNEQSEEELQNTTIKNIDLELKKHPNGLKGLKDLADIYAKVIKQVNDGMIGKTAYSVILTKEGVTELHHE